MNKVTTVRFYKTREDMMLAMANYISHAGEKVTVEKVCIHNEELSYAYEYIDVVPLEWTEMTGYEVSTSEFNLVFTSWNENNDVDDKGSQYSYEQAYQMFINSLLDI